MGLTFPSVRARPPPRTPTRCWASGSGSWCGPMPRGASEFRGGCLRDLDEVHGDRHRARDRVEDGGAGLRPRHDLRELLGGRVALDAEADADRLGAVWAPVGEAER